MPSHSVTEPCSLWLITGLANQAVTPKTLPKESICLTLHDRRRIKYLVEKIEAAVHENVSMEVSWAMINLKEVKSPLS